MTEPLTASEKKELRRLCDKATKQKLTAADAFELRRYVVRLLGED